jgi:hemerythrin-like domain-containing protein
MGRPQDRGRIPAAFGEKEATMRPTDTLAREHALAILMTKAAEQEVRYIRDTGEFRIDVIDELVDFFQYFTEACHDPKEENLLFARLRQRGLPGDTGLLAEFYREHQEFHQRLRKIEHWLRTYKKNGDGDIGELAGHLDGYLKLMRAHVAHEEELLFPIAGELLTDDDERELELGFDSIECEEVAIGVRQRYSELAQLLAGRPTETLQKEHKICYLVVAAARRRSNAVRGGDEFHPDNVALLVDFLRYFDECHDHKEDYLLFAKLAERGMSTSTGVLAEMTHEHEELRDRLETIGEHLPRARSGDRRLVVQLLDEIDAYLKLLEDHMQEEDDVLFPMVEHVLTHHDLELLAREYESVESQEIIEGVHEKYFELAHQLALAG